MATRTSSPLKLNQLRVGSRVQFVDSMEEGGMRPLPTPTIRRGIVDAITGGMVYVQVKASGPARSNLTGGFLHGFTDVQVNEGILHRVPGRRNRI